MAEPANLTDPEPTRLICSNCDAWVGEVLVTVPDPAADPSKVRGVCPWCGDYSWEVEVRGAYCVGCAAEPKDDDPESEWPSTALADQQFDGNLCTVVYTKASPDARKLH